MIVGGYELHLYCRNAGAAGHQPEYLMCQHSFSGSTKGECKRQAKKTGWRFADGDVVCPHCKKKKL